MPTTSCAAARNSHVTLTWPGKHLPAPAAVPALDLVETFEPGRRPPAPQPWPAPGQATNALFAGDNLGVLAHLRADGWQGRFRVIYADPPYNSGVNWTRKVRRREPRRSGSAPELGRQLQYADTWDPAAYLQFVYARLIDFRELLAADGTLWLHCDHRHAHHLRCLLEEVFGSDNYLNTITWRSQTARGAKVGAFYFPNSAHTILIFARDRAAPPHWRAPKKQLVMSEAQAAAEFMRDERGFFRTSDPGTYSFASLVQLFEDGRLYAPFGGHVIVDQTNQRVYCSNGGNLGVKYYLTALADGRFAVERAVDNVWDDIPGLGTTPHEDLGYPTQKTEALLTRILSTASAPGDWVLDPFCGSGTTLAVAQKLGRRWVGIDAGHGAIQTSVRRLQATIGAQTPARAADPSRFAGPPDSDRFTVMRSAGAATPPESALPATVVITRLAGAQDKIRICVGAPETDDAGTAAHPRNWLAHVDVIAIDPDYDGQVLRAALADAPLRKTQPVAGVYELPAPIAPVTVAVRITDIWGGERLVCTRIEM